MVPLYLRSKSAARLKASSRVSDGGDVKSPVPPCRVNLMRKPDTAAPPLGRFSHASRNQNYAYHPTIGLQSARLEHDIADTAGRDPRPSYSDVIIRVASADH
jgi:hypothetical protein